MAALPISRISGGGYYTDIDPWGRTVSTNLPPPHIIHIELGRLSSTITDLETEREDLLTSNSDLKRKITSLRAKLRTESSVDVKETQGNTGVYERIDSAISTADANILRAILREVCRESERAASIAASILPKTGAGSQDDERESVASGRTARTTSTRRTSVRFEDPPTYTTTVKERSTRYPPSALKPILSENTPRRRHSTSLNETPSAVNFDRITFTPTNENEIHTHKSRKHTSKSSHSTKLDSADPYTTPRPSKRRAEDLPEEQDSRKRRSITKAPSTCTNCNKEYQPSDNARGKCKKHSGTRLLDTAYWTHAHPNWDERIHGLKEKKVDDPEYAEGFLWSCCGEYGGVRRCGVGRHTSH